MKRYIRSARSLEDKIKGCVSWNGFFYGYVPYKRGTRYFKSHTARFDESMGGTDEITFDEYHEAAEKYARVFR